MVLRCIFFSLLLGRMQLLFAQNKLSELTVEKIMRDPKWIGTSPSKPYWSVDGRFFFLWNLEAALSDSVYYVSPTNKQPQKTSYAIRQNAVAFSSAVFNKALSAYTYVKDGDVYISENKTRKERRITQTLDIESAPKFMQHDTKIVYSRNQNLYAWDITTGLTSQLTNFKKEAAPAKNIAPTEQEKWLQADQLRTSQILKERKERKEAEDAANKSFPKQKQLRTLYTEDKALLNVTISPDARFVTYRLSASANGVRNSIIPDYVTESGFTTDIPGRTKVGAPEAKSLFYIYDRERDTVFPLNTDSITGIKDAPAYVKEYPSKDSAQKKQFPRAVTVYGPFWNESGTNAVLDIRSQDHKDRWIMSLEAARGELKLIDRQRDEAWIGGPGINSFFGPGSIWVDENTIWYQSEKTGYSHLYKANLINGKLTALTSGSFEVQQVQLSADKKTFYLVTNEVHPGEQQFYRMPVNGGKRERITTMTGANDVAVSPDEKKISILYSYSNKPGELYLQENKPGGSLQQITFAAQTPEFKSYNWRDPQIITFKARDNATVYARLYKPAHPHASKPAVIFVHGAGYLQNVHKWWSQYFREYLFHNLLADNGYTVLDIDYRGSSGYGRDWRTGIYRHMGGKDLTDQVDGVQYLVDSAGVDPKRIGIYGGSYGGFITLMAMFKEPGVFASGAGLRSVTDWAHYNHPYTSNILNEPYNDSLAYKRSSPIYYAEGLKGNLLMCHGMVDVNVHFQDIVCLTQRLIELKKENWELAVYPVEDHGFVEPSSWTDEYKRIFKLFETTLKN